MDRIETGWLREGIVHAVLRLCGGRGRLLASLAAILYSGGVALLAIAVLYLCAASAFPSLRPAGDVSRADVNAFAAALITFAVCFAVFLVLLVAGLARTLRVSGLHPVGLDQPRRSRPLARPIRAELELSSGAPFPLRPTRTIRRFTASRRPSVRRRFTILSSATYRGSAAA